RGRADFRARSVGGPAWRIARAGRREDAAFDRIAHRRDDAVALSAAVAAEAAIHGARDRDVARPAAPLARAERAVVGLFARPLDGGGGKGGRPRRPRPALSDGREAACHAAAVREAGVMMRQARLIRLIT